MAIILPRLYIAENENLYRLIGQHFGLEIDLMDDVIHPCDENAVNFERCPAGYLRQWRNSAALEDAGSNLIERGNIFKVELDVQQFKIEEINVKAGNGFIVVEGRHNEKEDGQGFVSRHFVRKYEIPENCDTNRIESTLSTDKILTITIPKRLEYRRVIPIQFGQMNADAA